MDLMVEPTEEAQKYLFSLGYTWASGEREVFNYEGMKALEPYSNHFCFDRHPTKTPLTLEEFKGKVFSILYGGNIEEWEAESGKVPSRESSITLKYVGDDTDSDGCEEGKSDKSTFSVGDEVYIREDSEYYGGDAKSGNPKDVVGKVVDAEYCDGYHSLEVIWSNGIINIYRPSDLELKSERDNPVFSIPRINIPSLSESLDELEGEGLENYCLTSGLTQSVWDDRLDALRYMPVSTIESLTDVVKNALPVGVCSREYVEECMKEFFEERLTKQLHEGAKPKEETTMKTQIPHNFTGNLKCVRGVIADELSQEEALEILAKVEEELKVIKEGAGVKSAFVKKKIKTLHDQEKALLEILNDEEREG